MKIGDKVKFLSETGGGVVAGFQGKNIVLVEDEDGFQIPTPINEVVVIAQEDYSTAKVINRRSEAMEQKAAESPLQRGHRSVKAMLQEGQDENIDLSVPDFVDTSKEVSYTPKAEERQGGNKLSCYLAFVPMANSSINEPHFEAYFVNDSNYYLQYLCATKEGNSCSLKTQGEAEPNTKVFIEELDAQAINQVGRVTIQIIAYKKDKPFLLKNPVSVELRLEPLKFYKGHTFKDTPFFEQPALCYTIIENDVPSRSLVIDQQQLKREMYRDASPSSDNDSTEATTDREQLVRRYSNEQSKGNAKHSPYQRHRGLDDAIVIDLHAEQILDTTAGMNAGDILEYQLKNFRDTIKQYAGHKGQKLIFIHGKGAGVLRRAIINELTYKYKNYTYQDASFQEYGYGATLVTIK